MGPAHILLGLTREGQGVAARVRLHLGLDSGQIRRAILRGRSGSEPTGDDDRD